VMKVLLMLCALACVHADLPNHCLWGQVKGKWTFHMSAAGQDKNIKCSKASNNFGSGDFGLGEPAQPIIKSVQVHLEAPNIARMKQGDKEHLGTWTMIYDEGFEVRVNSHKFFAFSKYTSSVGSTRSLCHQTFPGWFHEESDPDNKNWGCYHGEKEPEGGEVVEHEMVDLVAAEALLDIPYKPEHKMVADINSRPEGTWKAKVYPQFLGKTLKQLHQMGGRRLTQPYKALVNNRKDPKTLEEASVMLQEGPDVSSLPKAFDWRNADGQNYVGPVENQGFCGSCYAHASMDALASRMRIKTKNQVKPKYSIDNILKCSEYSQGCAGGYGYLVGKYAQDFGVKEHGEKGAGECHDDKPAARAGDYYYVGGFYGGSDWKSMMHDLHKHGPIVVGFATSGWLYHYEEGVFIDETMREEVEGTKTVHVNPWQHTDHAVVIVGWGEDKKAGKYWIVKNSWGAEWGNKGYFNIARGVNAQVIESKPVGFIAQAGDQLKVEDIYRAASLKAFRDMKTDASKSDF